MNLKLNEWNIACEYASLVCESLKDNGHNVKAKPYSLYDGRKGIDLQVFDNYGHFFTQYATGVHEDLTDMKNAIDTMARKIAMALNI